MSRGLPEALAIARRPAAHPALGASILHWTRSGKLLTYLCLAGVVAFVITPFLWMLLGSFKPTYELLQQQGQTLWIAHPTLENYQRLFREYDFVRYFLNSLLVATVTAIVATSLSAFAGYSLARFQFPGRSFFGVLILVTQMLPGLRTPRIVMHE